MIDKILKAMRHIPAPGGVEGVARLTYCPSCNTLAPREVAPTTQPCKGCGGQVYGELIGHWEKNVKSVLDPSTWSSKGAWKLLVATLDRILFLYETRRNLEPGSIRLDMPADFFNLDFTKKGLRK